MAVSDNSEIIPFTSDSPEFNDEALRNNGSLKEYRKTSESTANIYHHSEPDKKSSFDKLNKNQTVTISMLWIAALVILSSNALEKVHAFIASKAGIPLQSSQSNFITALSSGVTNSPSADGSINPNGGAPITDNGGSVPSGGGNITNNNQVPTKTTTSIPSFAYVNGKIVLV